MQPQPDRTAFYAEDLKPEPLRRVVGFMLRDVGLTWALAEQVAIAILSLLAIAMISSTGGFHRWGFVVGLASQPLWIHATWRARQWGMLLLSIGYVGVWISGIAARFL